MVRFWRQLRWRIIGAQIIIIIVGVTTLLFAARLIIQRNLYDEIERCLVVLTQAGDAISIAEATTKLISTFDLAVLWALMVAGLASLGVGLVASIFLTREILRPLSQITEASQRIADGHYDERVAVPDSDELAQMATQYNRMAASLEQVEQQRVALIGNVSHELRTPLTGIEGYLEGVMDGVLPNDTETFALMYQEVRRLRRLVDDLQALSRVEAGQLSLRMETVDLIPLVRRVVRQLQPQTVAQDLDVVTECPAALPIHADPDRTAQILLNLVGNAIRYTPEGGHIEIDVTCDQHAAEVAVRDDGIGIPAEALPYIFERFYRVDTSRARSSGGSGIGLTIARHLAWNMGGDLHVRSDGPNQGSTFTLTLPLARGEAIEA